MRKFEIEKRRNFEYFRKIDAKLGQRKIFVNVPLSYCLPLL
jgi:hypothetical protein